MAMYYPEEQDPFVPVVQEAVPTAIPADNVPMTQGPAPATSVVDEWQKGLENPKMRAALLQFGLNMMTPASSGQSGLGHFAASIGAAGEAVGRGFEQDRKEEETDIKRANSESQDQYRMGQLDNKAQSLALQEALGSSKLENQRLGLEIKKAEQESKAAERLYKYRTIDAQVGRLEAQINLLNATAGSKQTPEQVAALAQAKQQLQQAQAARAEVLTQLEPEKVAQGQQKADASTVRAGAAQQNADTRTEAEKNLSGRSQQNRELRRGEALVKLQQEYRKTYEKDIEFNNNIVNRNQPKKVIPDFDTWASSNNPDLYRLAKPGGRVTPAPTTTTPPATTTPPTTTTATPQAKEGDIIVNPKTKERRQLQNGEWVKL